MAKRAAKTKGLQSNLDLGDEPSDVGMNLGDGGEGGQIGDAADAEVQKAAPAPKQGMPKTRRIVLEENDLIPPTGLFIGVNGRSYKLLPGYEADVPLGVIDVLKNAIVSMPVTEASSRRVTGYRDRMRYPFRYVE